MITEFLTIVLAYLIGSIPFGLLLSKFFGYGDIRKIGSGNIGTTNVLRTGNKALAAATLLFDSGKIIFSIILAKKMGLDAEYLVGSVSLLGHLFPVWLRFKGGKGVASFLGLSIYLFPKVALLLTATWVVTFALSRYSSLAAIVACLVGMVALAIELPFNVNLFLMIFIMLLILFKHKDNMIRLINGQESKFNKFSRR